jgi:hypothetical protein
VFCHSSEICDVQLLSENWLAHLKSHRGPAKDMNLRSLHVLISNNLPWILGLHFLYPKTPGLSLCHLTDREEIDKSILRTLSKSEDIVWENNSIQSNDHWREVYREWQGSIQNVRKIERVLEEIRSIEMKGDGIEHEEEKYRERLKAKLSSRGTFEYSWNHETSLGHSHLCLCAMQWSGNITFSEVSVNYVLCACEQVEFARTIVSF